MNDNKSWADSQNEKLNRIKDLLDEILENHKKMQEVLSDSLVKVQTERGVRDIERYLRVVK